MHFSSYRSTLMEITFRLNFRPYARCYRSNVGGHTITCSSVHRSGENLCFNFFTGIFVAVNMLTLDTIVYNATFSYYPGVFNFLSAGLYLLCYTFIAIICDIQKSMGESTAYEHIGR
uniref:Uncharacterized protein n=1 Tax=Glossina pallidipes TaxID=7398 RepID=A0A1A9ZGN4_GLOPL